MNKTIIAILIAAAGLIGCHKSVTDTNTANTENKTDTVSKAVINSALQVSEMDASILSGISERLENSCDRNKFGLSEEACIQAIRTRKDICTQETAQKYPGQISNVEKMQEVASNYVNCLFQQ